MHLARSRPPRADSQPRPPPLDVACSRGRVCNPVCTCGGHIGARPGTAWHNREADEGAQARACGSDRHSLALRGTTWHTSRNTVRVLHGPPLLRAKARRMMSRANSASQPARAACNRSTVVRSGPGPSSLNDGDPDAAPIRWYRRCRTTRSHLQLDVIVGNPLARHLPWSFCADRRASGLRAVPVCSDDRP